MTLNYPMSTTSQVADHHSIQYLNILFEWGHRGNYSNSLLSAAHWMNKHFSFDYYYHYFSGVFHFNKFLQILLCNFKYQIILISYYSRFYCGFIDAFDDSNKSLKARNKNKMHWKKAGEHSIWGDEWILIRKQKENEKKKIIDNAAILCIRHYNSL